MAPSNSKSPKTLESLSVVFTRKRKQARYLRTFKRLMHTPERPDNNDNDLEDCQAVPIVMSAAIFGDCNDVDVMSKYERMWYDARTDAAEQLEH